MDMDRTVEQQFVLAGRELLVEHFGRAIQQKLQQIRGSNMAVPA